MTDHSREPGEAASSGQIRIGRGENRLAADGQKGLGTTWQESPKPHGASPWEQGEYQDKGGVSPTTARGYCLVVLTRIFNHVLFYNDEGV